MVYWWCFSTTHWQWYCTVYNYTFDKFLSTGWSIWIWTHFSKTALVPTVSNFNAMYSHTIQDEEALSYISYIGCGISIVCLLLTMTALVVFRYIINVLMSVIVLRDVAVGYIVWHENLTVIKFYCLPLNYLNKSDRFWFYASPGSCLMLWPWLYNRFPWLNSLWILILWFCH